MSRFVSGGSLDQPAERDDAWLKAQEELEADRRRRQEESSRNEGKSLFEVLQANKDAKQEAFEESIKLKNQFRGLTEDEVEFLDSVQESTRQQEASVRKETSEKLATFRKHQEDAERAALGNSGSPGVGEETWKPSGKKRKKGQDKEIFKGIKRRKSSLAVTKEDPPAAEAAKDCAEQKKTDTAPDTSPTPSISSAPRTRGLEQPKPNSIEKPTALPIPGLGLNNYSSDESD